MQVNKAKKTNKNKTKKKQKTNIIKKPGRPWKKTKVDDCRTLSLVKKNPFTTLTEVKNNLECEGVTKYRGFKTRCKPPVTFKSRRAREDFYRKHLRKKKLPCSGIRFFR